MRMRMQIPCYLVLLDSLVIYNEAPESLGFVRVVSFQSQHNIHIHHVDDVLYFYPRYNKKRILRRTFLFENHNHRETFAMLKATRAALDKEVKLMTTTDNNISDTSSSLSGQHGFEISPSTEVTIAKKLKTLPKGEYYVGDLCYVLGHEVHDSWWKGFHHWLFHDDTYNNDNNLNTDDNDDDEVEDDEDDDDERDRSKEGPVCYRGLNLSFHTTIDGDGTYKDQYDNEYGVDACMIGCVAIKDLPNTTISRDEMKRLGNIVTFDKPFTTSYKKGIITIGHLHIDTNDCVDDDDEYATRQ